MPTPPTPPGSASQTARGPAPVRPAGPPLTPAQSSAGTSTNQTPAVQSSTPPKPHGELDRRTLQAVRTFDVLLRNCPPWRGVRLVEMDSWSLLLDVPEQRRVLLPKHAVDAYLLGRPG